MAKPQHALDFLAAADPGAAPVCAVFGKEPFFRRLVVDRLRAVLLGDDEFGLVRFAGSATEWREVIDQLSTASLFGGGPRLVVVSDADEFVSEHRPALERYVEQPRKTGVLVLEVDTWAATTRLAQAVAVKGLSIDCGCPTPARLVKWVGEWAKTTHRLRLPAAAAERLLELVGPEPGILDQELAKLASSAGPGGEASAALVEELVGGWRAKTTWEMLDAVLAGRTGEALLQLDRLLLAGENPIGLVAQMGASLRRYAAATQQIDAAQAQGRPARLRDALEQAGVKSFVLAKSEDQLRRLGRDRARQLYRWLLEIDLALKGPSSAPARARLALEQLVVKLSAR